MPPIETIVRPHGNHVSASVALPKGYASYSFRVVFVPIEEEGLRKNRTPADLFMDCPADLSELIGEHKDEQLSFFERSGGFGTEEFA